MSKSFKNKIVLMLFLVSIFGDKTLAMNTIQDKFKILQGSEKGICEEGSYFDQNITKVEDYVYESLAKRANYFNINNKKVINYCDKNDEKYVQFKTDNEEYVKSKIEIVKESFEYFQKQVSKYRFDGILQNMNANKEKEDVREKLQSLLEYAYSVISGETAIESIKAVYAGSTDCFIVNEKFRFCANSIANKNKEIFDSFELGDAGGSVEISFCKMAGGVDYGEGYGDFVQFYLHEQKQEVCDNATYFDKNTEVFKKEFNKLGGSFEGFEKLQSLLKEEINKCGDGVGKVSSSLLDDIWLKIKNQNTNSGLDSYKSEFIKLLETAFNVILGSVRINSIEVTDMFKLRVNNNFVIYTSNKSTQTSTYVTLENIKASLAITFEGSNSILAEVLEADKF